MPKHHQITGIIDPKYGNWVQITAEGDDLTKVLASFSRQAHLVADHTEDELREMVKEDPSLFPAPEAG